MPRLRRKRNDVQFCLDANISIEAALNVDNVEHVSQLSEYQSDRRGQSPAPDVEIARWCRDNGRVLVTLDADFTSRKQRAQAMHLTGVEVIFITHEPRGLFGHAGEAALHDTVDALVCRTFGVEVADLEGIEGNGTSRGSDAQGRAAQEHALRQALEIGGFEGNPQSSRIVTRLAQKRLSSDSGDDDDMSPQTWYGLDVCFAPIDAITKYPWRRDKIATEKWGAYGAATTDGSDLAVLEEVRDAVGAGVGNSASKSFECQIMDWCDDVTYAVHDVEDFYRVGMIPLNLIFGGATTASGPGSNDAEWEKCRSFVAEKWEGRDGWETKSLADRETSLDEIRQRLIRSAATARGDTPASRERRDRTAAARRVRPPQATAPHVCDRVPEPRHTASWPTPHHQRPRQHPL